MKHVCAIALLFALSVSALAAPPEVPGALKAEPGQLVRIPVKTAVEIGYQPTFADDAAFFDELAPRAGERRFIFQASKPGTYSVVFWTKGEVDGTVCTITVGGAPVPPGPDPKPPVPPEPKPPAAENPFGAMPGLRVLIVYESEKERDLPVDQYLVLRGAKFRDYLDSKCVADGYRMFDQNVKGDGWFRKAIDRTDRKSLPWIYIGKEAAGYSGPLPADVDATTALIAKYAGN